MGGFGVLGKKPEGARSCDGQKRYGICLHPLGAQRGQSHFRRHENRDSPPSVHRPRQTTRDMKNIPDKI